MALPLALFAAGAVISTLGRMKSDVDQARAERANAAYYREQQAFTLEQMFNERDIFDRKSNKLKGQQLAYAGGTGFTTTSNVLDQLGYESAIMQKERNMIIRNGEFKARLAGLKAEQSDTTAELLASPERMLGNMGGLLTSVASLKF